MVVPGDGTPMGAASTWSSTVVRERAPGSGCQATPSPPPCLPLSSSCLQVPAGRLVVPTGGTPMGVAATRSGMVVGSRVPRRGCQAAPSPPHAHHHYLPLSSSCPLSDRLFPLAVLRWEQRPLLPPHPPVLAGGQTCLLVVPGRPPTRPGLITCQHATWASGQC